MDGISELKGILEKKFDWNKARLDCFCRMLLALQRFIDLFGTKRIQIALTVNKRVEAYLQSRSRLDS